MCSCNNEKIRKQLRKEAKERIAKKDIGTTCLTQEDLDKLSKKDRIKMAKHLCDKEFR